MLPLPAASVGATLQAIRPNLIPVSQRLDQQAEGRRGLAAARIIEMIARIGRAPIHKHTFETALDDMGLGEVFGDIGEPKSRQRSVEHLERAVERKLAFDAHLDFTAALFELPGVEAA